MLLSAVFDNTRFVMLFSPLLVILLNQVLKGDALVATVYKSVYQAETTSGSLP